MTPDLNALLYSVKSLCRQVGAEILVLNEGDFKVDKKGYNDFVTEVDLATEKKLIAGLSVLFPPAGFIAEEESVSAEAKTYQWVIDPIDGTTNYVQHLPAYCISVALLKEGKPVLGVIYIPALRECFAASKGMGATLNEKPIGVSERLQISEALIATGFPYERQSNQDQYMNLMSHLIYASKGVRRFGSAAIDLAFVACGRFDIYYEKGLKPWDIAAGILIVEEAGGRVSQFDGSPDVLFTQNTLASNGHLHPSIQHLLKDYLS